MHGATLLSKNIQCNDITYYAHIDKKLCVSTVGFCHAWILGMETHTITWYLQKKKKELSGSSVQYTYTFIKMAGSLENTVKGWKMMFYRVSFLI